MRRRLLTLAAATWFVALSAGGALATAYFPLRHDQGGEEALRPAGATVYLFHSGDAEARRAATPGAELVVARIDEQCRAREVGTVRVLEAVGETYVRAVVTEGAVKPNDIARAGAAFLLVVAAEPCGE